MYSKFPFDYEAGNRMKVGVIGTYLASGYSQVYQKTIYIDDEVVEGPKVVAYAPANSINAPLPNTQLPTQLRITFDKGISLGSSGEVNIYKKSTSKINPPVQTTVIGLKGTALTVESATSKNENNVLVVPISKDVLLEGTEYYVTIDATVIDDFDGILTTTGYRFVTGQTIVVIDKSIPDVYSFTISNNDVDENQSAFTTVGTFSTSSNYLTAPYKYYFTQTGNSTDPAGEFFIQKSFTSEEYYLKTAEPLDFEKGGFSQLSITVEGANEVKIEETIFIEINDLTTEPPTYLNMQPMFVFESANIGTVMGVLSTFDPNQADNHTYSLLLNGTSEDDDNEKFEIVGDQIKSLVEFDAEVQDTFYIHVKSTDPAGYSIQKSFIIKVAKEYNGGHLTAGNINQEITFEDIADQTFSSQFSINLVASSNSGLEVTYEVVQGEGFIRFPNELVILAPGQFKVAAIQSGNVTFKEARVEKTFIVSQVTSTDELEVSSAVYPNPTTGEVYFGEVAAFEVQTLEGVSLLSGVANSVDLSSLMAGAYIVSINGVNNFIIKE